MMGKFSRNKGKAGEREFARMCRQFGYDTRRTAQYRGNTGDAGDVEGLPGIHVEVKRTETLRAWDYMEQSSHDAAKKGDVPIVAWRKNEHPWLVLIGFEDFMQLYQSWEADRGERESKGEQHV